MLALVVDDHPITRQGLAAMAAEIDGIDKVEQAGDLDEAWEIAGKVFHHVVLMDLRLGDRDSIDLITHLRRENPSVKILVVSMGQESIFAPRVIKAGANGFISKSCRPDEIVGALERVLSGRPYLSQDVIDAMISPENISNPGRLGDVNSLSNRELEVYRLIGQGVSTRRIAEKLSITARTVESHKDHIKRKLNLKDAAELAKQAALWIEPRQNRLAASGQLEANLKGERMNEVSGRFAKWVYETGVADGVPQPILLDGVDASVDLLMSGRSRISWDDYIKMLENYHAKIGTRKMRDSALEFGTTQELAFFSKIAGLFLSPKNLYRFMYRWAGNHFLRNVNFDFRALPDGTYRIVSRIDPSTRDSPVFFETLTNVLAGAPCRVGRPPAEVNIISLEPRQAEYSIEPPRPASIGWYLKWPLRAIASIPAFGSLFARQQEEIKATHSAVVRQQQDFRAMVEKISDSVLILDSDRRAVFANATARRTFTLDDTSSPAWAPSSALDPEHHAAWEHFLTAGESGEREFSFHTGQDAETTLSFGTPSRTLFGGIDALMLVGRDVTEAREVEARLRAVAYEERRRIAGDLHDGLGQVLTGINWQANLLAKQLESGDRSEHAEKARSIAELATDSTRQARDLAHGLAGIDERRDNLRRALTEHARKAEREFGLDVSLSLPPMDEPLSAPGQAALEILRIVQEATHNAIKHAESSKLDIGVETGADTWRVTVGDHGHGLNDAAAAASTGLGIKSMQYRATALGGSVELRPRSTGGAELRLVLPPQEIRGTAIEAAKGLSDQAVSPREGMRRVAVADDHETVLQGIVALLGAEEDIEICAQTGIREDIVPLVVAQSPDVLVMDMLMDGDDNLDTITRLRAATPDLRIIVLSMFHEEQYGEAARNAGADAYVMKQAPPEELVAEVRSA